MSALAALLVCTAALSSTAPAAKPAVVWAAARVTAAADIDDEAPPGTWQADFARAPAKGHVFVAFDDKGYAGVVDVIARFDFDHTVLRSAPCRYGRDTRPRDDTLVRLGSHTRLTFQLPAARGDPAADPAAGPAAPAADPAAPAAAAADPAAGPAARTPLLLLEIAGDATTLAKAHVTGAFFGGDLFGDEFAIDVFGDGRVRIVTAPVASCQPPAGTRGWWALCEQLVLVVGGRRTRTLYEHTGLGCG